MLARQLVEERGATLAETARYLVVTSFFPPGFPRG